MNIYVAQFDEGYGAQGFPPGSLPQQWVDGIPRLKQAMNTFLQKKQALEREFQQLVVRTNNYSRIANATDYYVVDIEYDNRDRENRGRFDLVMVRWESDGASRKLTGGRKAGLALVEMRYGEDALSSGSTRSRWTGDGNRKEAYACHAQHWIRRRSERFWMSGL